MNENSVANSAVTNNNTFDNSNSEDTNTESTDNPKQTYEEFIANKRLLANKKIVDTVEKEFSQIREISLNTPDSFLRLFWMWMIFMMNTS